MSTDLIVTPRTKKAAKAAGFISETQLARARERRVPRRDADPVMIKGEAFYRPDQLEQLISRSAARRQDVVPIDDAEVYQCYAGRAWYDAFRISDCVPMTDEHREAGRATRRAADQQRRADRAAERQRVNAQIEWLKSLLDPDSPVMLPQVSVSELD